MKAFFSSRHREALDKRNLKPSFSKPLRVAIARVLDQFSDCDNWRNWTFEAAEETLKTFYGQESLRAYDGDGKLVEASFQQVIKNGYPTHVLDAIEAWFDEVNPDAGRKAEAELNDLMPIHRSPWRFVNGIAILMDSEYMHTEVIANSVRLMGEARAIGAQEEFQAALSSLQAGDFKNAVTEAHKSVESVMKTVLETDVHEPFGKLLGRVVKSGIVPQYYEDFLTHFKKLALGVVKERNQPGTGHGQGKNPRELTRGLAQFTVHLAASVNLFLIERWLESRTETREPEEELVLVEDDIPF